VHGQWVELGVTARIWVRVIFVEIAFQSGLWRACVEGIRF